MSSPDIDADAATVHAAEESAMELFVGYGGPRDPHGPALSRSELDAFALETLNAAYRSKVRPPTFSVDTPPDIHWNSEHRGGNWIVHLNPSQLSRWTVLHEMAHWLVPFDGHGEIFRTVHCRLVGAALGGFAREHLIRKYAKFGVPIEESQS